MFSIVNGDRTNEMWLESPSMKLKYEFMHWIAISTMGRHNGKNEVLGYMDEPASRPISVLKETMDHLLSGGVRNEPGLSSIVSRQRSCKIKFGHVYGVAEAIFWRYSRVSDQDGY